MGLVTQSYLELLVLEFLLFLLDGCLEDPCRRLGDLPALEALALSSFIELLGSLLLWRLPLLDLDLPLPLGPGEVDGGRLLGLVFLLVLLLWGRPDFFLFEAPG